MLEMRAFVISTQGTDASVQPVATGGCGHCTREGGCGSGTLTKVFCTSKPRHFKVRNAVQARVGDEVMVSLPDGVLMRGAFKMYVLPLLLLLIGGALGAGMSGELALRDAYAAAGAVGGLLLGFILARVLPEMGQAVASSIVSSKSGS
jgi:sigma-E factor negative regulatory protein RseC